MRQRAKLKKDFNVYGEGEMLFCFLSLTEVIAMITIVEDLPTTISLTALIIQGLDTDEK